MALVTAVAEPDYTFVAFDTKAYPLRISPRQRLDDVVNLLAQTGGGGTDCALPMQWAVQNRVAVDAFVILTDAQTWAGHQHPAQAVQAYRREMGIPAKLVVVAMAANGHTIGDPGDAGVMNVVGFDTATPQLVADFVKF
jgi:60 kDa SS-A/Ro ribonucleoprotein